MLNLNFGQRMYSVFVLGVIFGLGAFLFLGCSILLSLLLAQVVACTSVVILGLLSNKGENDDYTKPVDGGSEVS